MLALEGFDFVVGGNWSATIFGVRVDGFTYLGIRTGNVAEPLRVGKKVMPAGAPEGRQPVPAHPVAGYLHRFELDHEIFQFRIRVDLPEGFDGETRKVAT